MSVSEIKQQFTLQINALDEFRFTVKASIFDATSKIVEKGIINFPFYRELNKGLYVIRVEVNGGIKDTFITLNSDKRIAIGTDRSELNYYSDIVEPPNLYSSALFYDNHRQVYKNTHEYYTERAREFAEIYTADVPGVNNNSSLFIFLRYPSDNKFREYSEIKAPIFNNFLLLDEGGHTMFDFSDSPAVHRHHDGWAAFNIRLECGMFFLKYKGQNGRMIPVYVFRGWHTQLFLTLADEPLYGSIRVFLNETREYDPYDRNNKIIDILVNKLQNNDYSLNQELIQIIAHNKFNSPMLGLIGTYIYLSGNTTKDDNLFREIATNMRKLILKDNEESPDIRALTILANQRLGTQFKVGNKAVRGTPMFRIGYEAIKKSAVKHSRLIKQNSLNDLILENACYDSPYNTFKPVDIQIAEFPENNTRINNLEELLENIKIEDLHQIEDTVNFQLPNIALEYLSNPIHKSPKPSDIKGLLGESKFNELIGLSLSPVANYNWLTYSIAELASKDASLTVKQLSEKLQVPDKTISRVIKTFNAEKKYLR